MKLETARQLNTFLRHWGTLVGLLVTSAVFAVLSPVFGTLSNIVNVFSQVCMLAIISTGLTIALVAGDFDLSIASVTGLTGVLVTGLMTAGINLYLSLLAGLALAALIGLLNGFVVTRLGVSAFVTTLATGSIATGVNFMYTRGQSIYGSLPDTFAVIGRGNIGALPVPVLIMLVVVLVGHLTLEKTVAGRHLYAIGGNVRAAILSGVNVGFHRMLALVVSAVGAGLTGIVLASRLGSGQPTAGGEFLMDAMAASFLGMTTFKEGQPNVLGTFVGVLIIGVMNNGLTLLGASYYIQNIIKGVIILLAVSVAATQTVKVR